METIREEFEPFQAELTLSAYMTLSSAGAIQFLEMMGEPVDYRTKIAAGIIGLATIWYAMLLEEFSSDEG